MKLLFTLSLVCLVYTSKGQSPASKSGFEWLEGTWERLHMKPGRSGYELWSRTSDSEWKGTGVTLIGSDTTFIEKLKIINRDGQFFYVADVPENKGSVYFAITTLTRNSFVCENPEHDFPKKIMYSLEENEMKATISGNGKSIEYRFIRK